MRVTSSDSPRVGFLFCHNFEFSFISHPLLAIIILNTHKKRKITCYVICSIKETIPQLPSLFRNYRHCQMKCAWGSPVFLQYFLYISQSGRSKWTFPVIWFSLTSDERSYIYLSIIWAETVSLKEAEYVTVKCVYSLQSRSSIQLSASNTENFFGTQITVILYNLPSWIFSITFYNYV